ncbi:methionine synthase [Streptomyces noursei]|uniref:Methionine synthase n=1 Tax=Streptomyces noursei TaxID=1971 RepID=A0A401RDQ7_STRNR|nr:methionine synthase [Streptomyces noursei]
MFEIDEHLIRFESAARIVLNSVFLDECVKAGLDSAIVHASKILPIARFDEEQVTVARDLIYDRRPRGMTRCRS